MLIRYWAEGERGSSSVSSVLLFPMLIALVWAVLQGAWVYHGANVAEWAASGALSAARVEGGADADARVVAADRLAAANGVLQDAQVDIARTGTTVTVTVSGRVDSMIPFVNDWAVSKTASGAVERFTTAGAP